MLVSAVATMVIQTGGGSITIKELHWETDGGFAMDGWLFIPDGATAENPAPGIVTSHGMYNNKGMQDANVGAMWCWRRICLLTVSRIT